MRTIAAFSGQCEEASIGETRMALEHITSPTEPSHLPIVILIATENENKFNLISSS